MPSFKNPFAALLGRLSSGLWLFPGLFVDVVLSGCNSSLISKYAHKDYNHAR